MALDFVTPFSSSSLDFLSLGDFSMLVDVEPTANHHRNHHDDLILDMGVLSLLEDEFLDDDDVAKTLSFVVANHHIGLSEPLVRVTELPTPAAHTPRPSTACKSFKREPCKPTKKPASSKKSRKPPAAKKPRFRTRTTEMREKENMSRKAKVEFHLNERKRCIELDRQLRSHVRRWIAGYADAMELPLDARILSYLPLSLREIMWRSDMAWARYNQFTGRKELLEAVNPMPTWW